MILIFSIIVGVIALDQLTKWLAIEFLADKPTVFFWENVLHFTYSENTGMAFGLLSDQRWIFMVLSTVAIIGIVIYLIFFKPKNIWLQISLAMIVGGGIGNMIDRIFRTGVVDFIILKPIKFIINDAIFNIADTFVCIGAGIMIVYLIIDMIKEFRDERAAKKTGTAKGAANEVTSTSTTAEQNGDDNVE